jgi:hypothetical protein
VLDAFKSHLTPEVKSAIHAMNTDLVVISGGMTLQLQVLVAVVNKPFKDHLKQLYSGPSVNDSNWFHKSHH